MSYPLPTYDSSKTVKAGKIKSITAMSLKPLKTIGLFDPYENEKLIKEINKRIKQINKVIVTVNKLGKNGK